MKLTPWYLAAIAPIAAAGCSGTMFGHFAVLAVTLGIFIGTLSLGRHASSSASAMDGPEGLGIKSDGIKGDGIAILPGFTSGLLAVTTGQLAHHETAPTTGTLAGLGLDIDLNGALEIGSVDGDGLLDS